MKNCLRCNHETTPDQLICSNCGLALNKKVAEEQIKGEKKRVQDVANEVIKLLSLNLSTEMLEKAIELKKAKT